ncbi:MAG: hypothetical protein WC979_02040 [Candidatus Pacearchaeota archaeon]|jgi:uncharacterized protein YcsI (UPF0317 family)|nr:hypothetical protein [Clostridia bacterium]
MAFKRLYSISEFTKKNGKVHQKRMKISGDINELHELQYRASRKFKEPEVIVKFENENLVILFDNYLDERLLKFIDKNAKNCKVIDENEI